MVCEDIKQACTGVKLLFGYGPTPFFRGGGVYLHKLTFLTMGMFLVEVPFHNTYTHNKTNMKNKSLEANTLDKFPKL